MPRRSLINVSRRERQIMDIVYREREVAVADVQRLLPDPPTYSAVRAMLRVLEEKGYLAHRRDGMRYLYRPTVPKDQARKSALKHLVQTFFDGSAERAVASLLDFSSSELSHEQLDRLKQLIDQAKKEGR